MADDLRYPSRMIDRLEDDELRNYLVTEEEIQLLDPKYHYVNHYVNHSDLPKYIVAPSNATESDHSLEAAWNTVSYPLVVIRKAYVNLKLREEETDILKILKDQPWIIIHSTASLRAMKDYIVGVRKILDSFYQNTSVQAAGFPKSLPRKFRFGKESHSIRGSKRNRCILLFMKEILSILLGNDQSEVYEGHKRLGNAELIGLVEARVKQLYVELRQKHDLLIHLIRIVHGEYAHNKDVYAVGWAAYKQRKMLHEELCGHAWNTTSYFQPSCFKSDHRVEADKVIDEIFLLAFFEFSLTLEAGELPTYWEGFFPAPAPPTNSQRMMYQALQARATLQRPSTLGAGELPTSLEGSSLALAPTDSQRMMFEALKARATLQRASNSLATSYSPELLQSQQRLATHLQITSNSPATSYSSGMLQQSLQQLASLQQRPSNSPATSNSPEMLQNLQRQQATIQRQATLLRQAQHRPLPGNNSSFARRV